MKDKCHEIIVSTRNIVSNVWEGLWILKKQLYMFMAA